MTTDKRRVSALLLQRQLEGSNYEGQTDSQRPRFPERAVVFDLIGSVQRFNDCSKTT